MRKKWHRIWYGTGFTLVEIILVIAMIGISATLVVSLVDPVQQFRKSNDAKRKADLKQIQAALELFRADQGRYPDATTEFTCGDSLASVNATYLQKIPCDPRNTGNFVYTYIDNITSYTLYSCLENVIDPQKDTDNNATYCDGATSWSYTLTSF